MRHVRCGGRRGSTIVAAFVLAAEAGAQSRTDPSAAEVAALLREHGHTGRALSVLSQASGANSQHQRDEIADSIVAIAISFPGRDLRSGMTRLAAVTTLFSAGEGRSGIVGRDHAVPYTGATVRLMRIAETANDVAIRATALRALNMLPDRERLLPFLQQVATSDNRAAWVAVSLLAGETGPAGHAIARELFLGGLVTERLAVEILNGHADANGWRRDQR